MATKESDSDTKELVTAISEKEGITDPALAASALNKAVYQLIREQILDKSIRPDGRKLDEIRQITVRTGELPRTHGSAMFQRGSTQALTIVTLASPANGQLLESRNLKKPNTISIITICRLSPSAKPADWVGPAAGKSAMEP